jgi:hypothetical protein
MPQSPKGDCGFFRGGLTSEPWNEAAAMEDLCQEIAFWVVLAGISPSGSEPAGFDQRPACNSKKSPSAMAAS